MNAKELQIGDLVDYRGKVIKVTSLYTKNGSNEVGFGNKEDTWVQGDVLKPIPLTREILEKNGFVKWSDHSRTTRSCSMLFDKNTSFCIQEIDGSDSMFTQIHRCGAGSFEHRMHIKYVHQLQQLFCLCCIDKEIIIA